MSDKLKQTISVVPYFNAGESPSPEKLNVLGLQLQYAATALERAVGDIHGESWPYTTPEHTRLSLKWGRSRTTDTPLSGTADRSLDIANLARVIGPASNLNPRQLGRKQITEAVPVGVHEFSLRFVPEDPTAVGVVFSDTARFDPADFTADPTDVGFFPNEWSVTAEGKVYCLQASNGGTVTYWTNPVEYAGGMSYPGARFNVIPDPNQSKAGGGNLAFAGPVSGVWTITLPVVNQQQSNLIGNDVNLSDADPNNGIQLTLPRVLTDMFDGNDIIPSGFLALKNIDTNEVYDDAVYRYGSPTTLTASGTGLESLAANIAAGHQFCIITVGTDITTSIDDLRVKSFHSHDRAFGEPFIDIDSISGILKHAEGYVVSEIPGNFAPQYLHRDGWVENESVWNSENIMRGSIVVGHFNTANDVHASSNQDSFSLYLGHPNNDHGRIYYAMDEGEFRYIVSGGSHVFKSAVVESDNGFAGNSAVTSLGVKFFVKEGTVLASSGATVDIDISELAAFTVLNVDILINGTANEWYPPGFNDIPSEGNAGDVQYPYDMRYIENTPKIVRLHFSSVGSGEYEYGDPLEPLVNNLWPVSPTAKNYRLVVMYR